MVTEVMKAEFLDEVRKLPKKGAGVTEVRRQLNTPACKPLAGVDLDAPISAWDERTVRAALGCIEGSRQLNKPLWGLFTEIARSENPAARAGVREVVDRWRGLSPQKAERVLMTALALDLVPGRGLRLARDPHTFGPLPPELIP